MKNNFISLKKIGSIRRQLLDTHWGEGGSDTPDSSLPVWERAGLQRGPSVGCASEPEEYPCMTSSPSSLGPVVVDSSASTSADPESVEDSHSQCRW